MTRSTVARELRWPGGLPHNFERIRDTSTNGGKDELLSGAG